MSDFRDIEAALHDTQELVLDLMPDAIRAVLQTSMSSSFGAVHNWRRVVIPQVIGFAERDDSGRARCPLCHVRPQQGFHDGFTLPGGLTRHLDGSHNFYRCGVMTVAEAVAKRAR
ncbi:MAG: hypothetical protein WC565_07015 [Parcubacteria group bacterium]